MMPDRNDLNDYINIVELLNEVDERAGSWLQRRGWKYDCNFPDHCWRWCKTLDGRTIALCQKDALRLEAYVLQGEFIDDYVPPLDA
jgi:hypothetical protein